MSSSGVTVRASVSVVVLISAEEALAEAPRGAATEIVPKRKLSRALLKRLWEEHGEPLVGS